ALVHPFPPGHRGTSPRLGKLPGSRPLVVLARLPFYHFVAPRRLVLGPLAAVARDCRRLSSRRSAHLLPVALASSLGLSLPSRLAAPCPWVDRAPDRPALGPNFSSRCCPLGIRASY